MAKNSFKNDAKARGEIEDIERSVQVSMAGELKNRAKRSPVIAIIVAVVILVVLGGLVSAQSQKRRLAQCAEKYDQDASAETIRLDGLVVKATNELKGHSFSDALTTSSGLHWNLRSECKSEAVADMSAQWDQKRTELTELIKAEEAKLAEAQKAEEDKISSQEKAVQEKIAADEAAANSKAATAARNAATEKEF